MVASPGFNYLPHPAALTRDGGAIVVTGMQQFQPRTVGDFPWSAWENPRLHHTETGNLSHPVSVSPDRSQRWSDNPVPAIDAYAQHTGEIGMG